MIAHQIPALTDLGNTRSNSQTTQDARPAVGLDWLDMRGVVNSADLIDILEWVADACDDVCDWTGGKPFGRHKILGQSVRSVRGAVYAWQVNGEVSEVLISLSGTAIAGAGSVRGQCRLLSRLCALGLRATRIDIYLDDSTGILARLREDAFEAYLGGHAHGFKKWGWWDSRETYNAVSSRTAYLGSRQSDSFVRIYDKESRVRWERQTRAEIANAVALDLVTFHDAVDEDVEYDVAILERLKSHLIGNISFLSLRDKNLDRAEVLPFWSEFLEWIEQPQIRVAKPEKPRLLEVTMRWIDRQVGKSLALVKKVSRENWAEYLATLLKRGEERFTGQDELVARKFSCA